jgi:hypothetical protein
LIRRRQIDTQKADIEARKLLDETKELIKQARPKLQQFNATFERVSVINKELAEICSGPPSDQVQVSSTSADQDGKECGSLYFLAQNTRRLDQYIAGIDQRISDLDPQRARPPDAISTQTQEGSISRETQEKLREDLRIKQVAEPLIPATTGSRTYYDLTFSVCIRDGNQCDSKGLENVERVIYYFDASGVSPSVVTSDNRAENFAHHVHVWARTQVTACIYLKGETPPVVRSGQMSFVRASQRDVQWGPGASSEGCASSTRRSG